MNYLILKYCIRDFIHLLSKMEEKLKDDCQLNCERCPMVTRLRRYLEKVSIYSRIQFVLNIRYRMGTYLNISLIKLRIIFDNPCKKIHHQRFHKQYDTRKSSFRFIQILNIYI
jgi:hypothetical protein